MLHPASDLHEPHGGGDSWTIPGSLPLGLELTPRLAAAARCSQAEGDVDGRFHLAHAGKGHVRAEGLPHLTGRAATVRVDAVRDLVGGLLEALVVELREAAHAARLGATRRGAGGLVPRRLEL